MWGTRVCVCVSCMVVCCSPHLGLTSGSAWIQLIWGQKVWCDYPFGRRLGQAGNILSWPNSRFVRDQRGCKRMGMHHKTAQRLLSRTRFCILPGNYLTLCCARFRFPQLDWVLACSLDGLIVSLIDCSIHPFIHSFIHSFIQSVIHSFIHPFIHSCICSSTHPFILISFI